MFLRSTSLIVCLGLLFSAGVACSPRLEMPGAVDRLAAEFKSPPEAARPWVYWMWMDGNLNREGLTADLEAMKRAGIGGVIVMEVNVGVPRGPVEFMSDEWRSMFKHVVSEAERLGLEITLNAGPGWTGSGGPWVKPEESMRHLVASALDVTGPWRFDGPLPRPQRRPAFFGDGVLPPALEQAKNEYYRDVMVLAFPSSVSGAAIPDIDEKALYVRAPYSSQEGVKPFLPSPADFPEIPVGAAIDASRIVDITARLASDGRLVWDVPEGNWTILRFGMTSTGANSRPAPVPGLGLECDKFDKAALDAHFEAFIGALLREIGPRNTAGGAGWTMLHIDSWEMGAQNWTGAFREEFRRRRGYDCQPYLPAITGLVVGNREISERFLWDLRLTAQELVVENHALHLKELGRRNGFGLSIEPYDMNPCADMTLGAVADVPMGEFWLYGFNTAHSVIEASGIAHTNGRKIMAAEAFTSSSDEAWKAHPASMKALGDWAFAAGVNRIVFHRSQHQPWADVRPGMTMGPYGVRWERTQTWWEMSSAYHFYLARCQHLLRQGLPVADVCFLVAEGAPHVFRAPASALRGSPPDRLGYSFDACAPETLLAKMSVQGGRLVLPDGMSYQALVLPERQTMTPALLRKVKDLVAAGATVVGPRPRKSPSLVGYPACDAEVEALAEELWGNCDGVNITERAFDKGRIVWEKGPQAGASSSAVGSAAGAAASAGENIASRPVSIQNATWDVGPPPLSSPEQYGDFTVVIRVLQRMGIPPDFEFRPLESPPSANIEKSPLPPLFKSGVGGDFPGRPIIRYTHRRDGQTDIYFVSNTEDRRVEAACLFRVTGRRPELWDAVTGEIRDLAQFKIEGGLTSVPLMFEPYQSFFIVFRKPAPRRKSAGPNFVALTETARLEGPWEVSFDPKWGGPERITFEKLEDWSQRPEDGVKYYSGTATYRKTFDLPFDMPSAGEKWKKAGRDRDSVVWLALGTVNNIAAVSLNGRDLGIVWCAPWRVDISGVAVPAGNVLEIRVANLWPNRLIGDEHLPPDAEYGQGGNLARRPDWLLKGAPRPSPGRFTFSTWKHYTKDMPLLPSGLLGPVVILAGPETVRSGTGSTSSR